MLTVGVAVVAPEVIVPPFVAVQLKVAPNVEEEPLSCTVGLVHVFTLSGPAFTFGVVHVEKGAYTIVTLLRMLICVLLQNAPVIVVDPVPVPILIPAQVAYTVPSHLLPPPEEPLATMNE